MQNLEMRLLQSLALALAAETGKRKQGTLREAGLKLSPLFEAIIHHIPHPQHPSCSSSYRKPQSGSFQHLRRHNKVHYPPSGLDFAVDRGEGVELSGGCPLWPAQGRETLAQQTTLTVNLSLALESKGETVNGFGQSVVKF